MGDNIYLGDRNGVRTPMQWTGDRNAGFSRANPARLYSPVIMDPVWGYEAINVEAQQSDPSSLLNWMRNMIALRKLFRVFGRGTLEFLESRESQGAGVSARAMTARRCLCVANLSRFAQPVQLDLSGLEGMIPVEMLGYVEFPADRKAAVSADACARTDFSGSNCRPRRRAWPHRRIRSESADGLFVAGPADWEPGPGGRGRAHH